MREQPFPQQYVLMSDFVQGLWEETDEYHGISAGRHFTVWENRMKKVLVNFLEKLESYPHNDANEIAKELFQGDGDLRKAFVALVEAK
jgi:hypothetical protein